MVESVAVAVGDVTGDGVADVIRVTRQNEVLIRQGAHKKQEAPTAPAPGEGAKAAAAEGGRCGGRGTRLGRLAW
jgi:hypothetical protein